MIFAFDDMCHNGTDFLRPHTKTHYRTNGALQNVKVKSMTWGVGGKIKSKEEKDRLAGEKVHLIRADMYP